MYVGTFIPPKLNTLEYRKHLKKVYQDDEVVLNVILFIVNETNRERENK